MTSTYPGRAYRYCNAEPSHSQVYLNAKLMRMIGSRTWPSSAKALDYGCGNGWLANCLAEKGFAATGVDISPSGIDVARQHFPRVDFTSDISAESLSRRGPFDLVTCIEVIAHCFTPIDELARIRVSMKSSGILVLSTPYHGYFKFLALAVSGRMEKHLDTSWAGAYVHHYTPRSISKVLDGAGLEVLAIERAGRIPALAKSMIVTCRKR
jgi:2-polyprenyl-3-methyl-5-hydroxy-6-metoxy-1,4-benzoquinol methylase